LLWRYVIEYAARDVARASSALTHCREIAAPGATILLAPATPIPSREHAGALAFGVSCPRQNAGARAAIYDLP
jgi:hypothetical protein